ncbi:hypothetical protein DMB38_12930 [Streptomyces sp. WAC 06738]|uniref:hypothetical protein n=1 Tax=Streptomyces sp. WAC 06738 TaxID=2203210 RepID=UPI000F6C0A61|nr:hypothetical protein [Streptomyces sp. WAC 06738]AZM46598.1 hypothetical protein DMB38_12930 [Streptomyces sp. WAC 06738]
MSARRRMVCGNDPTVQLSAGDREAVDDFTAWLKARQDGTLDEQMHAAADKLRPSSPAVAAHTVAVRISPAAADAVADLLDWCARAPAGGVAIPYEAHVLARRLLEVPAAGEQK